MTWSQYGRWLNDASWRGARDITHGFLASLLTLGDATIETIGLGVWVKTEDCSFGISTWGCCTDQKRYVLFQPSSVQRTDPLQLSVRQRGSISSHTQVTRNRAESQATMRFRSNSNLTADSVDGEGTIEHPVESRTRTAELPPVMVRGLGGLCKCRFS